MGNVWCSEVHFSLFSPIQCKNYVKARICMLITHIPLVVIGPAATETGFMLPSARLFGKSVKLCEFLRLTGEECRNVMSHSYMYVMSIDFRTAPSESFSVKLLYSTYNYSYCNNLSLHSNIWKVKYFPKKMQ